LADSLRAALSAAPGDKPTLHGYAASSPGARRFSGREIAYAVTLPLSDRPVVIRHNRHGGAFRRITGDLFVGETNAPFELAISLELATLGVPTPAVLAYAVYSVVPGIARSDVLTEEIPDSGDLGALLLETSPGAPERHRAWSATTRLLKRLSGCGVRHHDLNVKNILLRNRGADAPEAYVLDVDRVELHCSRREAYIENRARLKRSVEKWRRTRGARITDDEIAWVGGRYVTPDRRTTS
jgi:hypothetical protein